jgi:hypothetical protein
MIGVTRRAGMSQTASANTPRLTMSPPACTSVYLASSDRQRRARRVANVKRRFSAHVVVMEQAAETVRAAVIGHKHQPFNSRNSIASTAKPITPTAANHENSRRISAAAGRGSIAASALRRRWLLG